MAPEKFPAPLPAPVAAPQPGTPIAEMVPAQVAPEATTAVLPTVPEAVPQPMIDKKEAAALPITELVVASENEQVTDRTYFSIIRKQARKVGKDAGDLGERRMQLSEEMRTNEAQADDTQIAAYEAARLESVAIDDMTDFMRPRQLKAFTEVTGQEYLGSRPSRTSRALQAIANAPKHVTGKVVEVQNGFANTSRTSKFAGAAVLGAAGVILATKGVHVAGHGHEVLVQGAAHTGHANEASAAATANIDPTNVTLDADVVKKGHEAVADAIKQTTQGHGAPGVEAHNLPGDPHVYKESGLLRDITQDGATAIGVIALATPPVLLTFQKNERRYHNAEHHENHHHLEHKQHAMNDIRRVIVNHEPDGDAYLRLAKGRAAPNELLGSYMDLMAHRLHIHDTRHMAEHLRSLDIPVHQKELVRTQTGEFLYFPQGGDGFDRNSLRNYMEDPAVRGRYGTVDAMYRHLNGELGLKNIKRSQINLTGRGFDYAHVDSQGRPIRDSKNDTHSRNLDVKPERSGEFAWTRAVAAASVLRGKTESLPFYAEFLGNAPVEDAMQDLRYQIPGRPHGETYGLLDARNRQVARVATATRATHAAEEARLAAIDRDIHDRVVTILRPVAGNVTGANALGIFNLRAQRGSADGFAFADDSSSRFGEAEAALAAYLRTLDER